MATTTRPTKKKPAAKKSAAKKPVAKRAVAKKAGAKKSATRDPIARLREICLVLPEAHEVEAWGEPTFRVRNKIFAMHASASTHHGAGREAVWINSTHVTQDLLMRAKPDRYFRPPYVGPSGWVGVWVDGKPDWGEIADLLRDGYRKRAPKRLAAQIDDEA
ncbi:MAG TPA: MmcQ/YjbR family DNA-binding protein [Gemmatimonadaceae bacterium]|nr:MmcQ/YjbR family DNA-binding protein [Gemmatimonadaceae bacterium]